MKDEVIKVVKSSSWDKYCVLYFIVLIDHWQ